MITLVRKLKKLIHEFFSIKAQTTISFSHKSFTVQGFGCNEMTTLRIIAALAVLYLAKVRYENNFLIHMFD